MHMHAIYVVIIFLLVSRFGSSFANLRVNKNGLLKLPCKKEEEDNLPLCTEKPLKIALLVEPTPFNYVSGYSNRFKEMLKFLHKAGDQVYYK